jgi:acyl-CoA dehydrogenase
MLFEYSDKSSRLQQQLAAFMERHVYPNEAAYAAQLEAAADRFAPLPLMEELKQKARDEGLWNLFVPESHGEFSAHGGLSNLDYYPLAETMGRVLWSAEVFNCSAPDTGNMEVLMKYATPEQQQQWLEPLLAGEIRSSYAMTEPQVASSDATNIELSMTLEGDEWLLDGRKWFITGAMNQRTRIIIVMGKSDPANPDRHRQQTQVLVPRDAPGVEVVRALTTLGYDDAPIGHAEIHFNQVRVPAENVLLGAGRGFEIAQGRLGPGRMHHCMRLVGAAQRALEITCQRELCRNRDGAPADSADLSSHGPGWCPGGAGYDRGLQDQRAIDGAKHRRSLYADARRRRFEPGLFPCRGLQLRALVSPGGRPGPGAPHGAGQANYRALRGLARDARRSARPGCAATLPVLAPAAGRPGTAAGEVQRWPV